MPQNEEPSTKNLPSRAWIEAAKRTLAVFDDRDDADPGTKQRFQELGRKDTEHRTKFSALSKETLDDWRRKNTEARAREGKLALHDELCAMPDLLSQEEDYTND